MSDPWSEARVLRSMLRDSIDRARRGAVHAAVFGALWGIVVGYLLALAVHP